MYFINNISEQLRNEKIHPERKYVAISVKHSEHGWRFGKPLTLWGYHRTADDEERCFAGYTEVLSKAELYTIDDMSNHGYNGNICRKEPVHMSYDFCEKWKRYDSVLMEVGEYWSYCTMSGIDI